MKDFVERARKYAVLLFVVLAGASSGAAMAEEPAGTTAADHIVASIADAKLRPLLGEVLERNPRLARLRAEVCLSSSGRSSLSTSR